MTEESLRSYFRCSEYFNFGGLIEPNDLNKLYASAFEYVLTRRLAGIADQDIDLASTVNRLARPFYKVEGMITTDVDQTAKLALLGVHETMQLFKPDLYPTISGPSTFRIRVSQTPIDLHLGGIVRTRRAQTPHLICFTPYPNQNDCLNDPVVHLKLHALKNLIPRHMHRTSNAVIHMLSIGANATIKHRVLSEHEISDHHVRMVHQVVRSIEEGIHYPIIPCHYTCQFKTICNPLSMRDAEKRQTASNEPSGS